MGVKIGSLDISAFKVGSDDCSIYLGSVLVYSGGTPPTPPTPSYKWLATYNDSHTESAECDSTSAITKGNIMRTSLVDIQIGDCVTSIGNGAFESAGSLTSTTIGNGVISIGSYAFNSCKKLISITIYATTPPTLGGITFNSTNNCPIYVPSASVEIYKAAARWSDYANRIQAIPNS